MRLYNHMEEAVLNILDRILKDKDDICKCQKCRLDIAAIVLNNLPSKYSVTRKGELYTRVQEMEIQFEADIIREITKAIEKVSKEPHHDLDE